jgi:hypothetical protein
MELKNGPDILSKYLRARLPESNQQLLPDPLRANASQHRFAPCLIERQNVGI